MHKTRRTHLKRVAKRQLALHKKRVIKIRKHPFFLPITIFLVLFFLSGAAFINFNGKTTGASDAHVVQLNIAGKVQFLPTRAANVSDFLKRVNIELHPGDVVEPAIETEIFDDNFRVNIYRARPITIVEGGKKTQALSAAASPREVARSAGLNVYPEDNIEASASADVLKDGILGEKIVIDHATPVSLNIYGTPVTVRTHKTAVKDLLKEKNITLAPDDSVQPNLDTPITPNVQVFVTRSGIQIVTQEETLAAPTQYVEDSSLTLGSSAIRQNGTPGKKLVTYQVELKNGKEISRHIIQEVIQSTPVAQIVARGKAVDVPADKESIMAAAGISSSDYGYVNYIISRESGWCPTKLQGTHDCPAYAPASIPAGYGYGLPQATPGNKMSTAGADWQTNPVTQLRWASGYAQGRYGGWGEAYNYWLAHHNW